MAALARVCARQRRFRVCCALSCGGGSRDWVGALARQCCGAIGEVLTRMLTLAYILVCRVSFVRYRANKAHDVRWVAREKGKGPE